MIFLYQFNSYWLSELILLDCTYEKLQSVALSEGNRLGSFEVSGFDECREKCDQAEGCLNVRYCPTEKKCTLFAGLLTRSAPTIPNTRECHTFYKKCKFCAMSLLTKVFFSIK